MAPHQALVQGFRFPLDLSDPAIQAGLVGGRGKLAIDAADRFALRDEQAGQLLCEVAAFGSIGEQVAIFGQEVLDDGRKRDDGWHTIPWHINQGNWQERR